MDNKNLEIAKVVLIIDEENVGVIRLILNKEVLTVAGTSIKELKEIRELGLKLAERISEVISESEEDDGEQRIDEEAKVSKILN